MLDTILEGLALDVAEGLAGLNPWESWVCACLIALGMVAIDACCAWTLSWAWYAWVLAGLPLGWLWRLVRGTTARD